MAGQLILIVDDNPLNLKLVDYLLKHNGYETRSAMNAEETMSLLEKVTPDLILMDIQLPGMDGLELTRKLKAEEKYKKLPIIAITAFAMKGDEQKALAAGCSGYISKPIDVATFPNVIAGYLQGDK